MDIKKLPKKLIANILLIIVFLVVLLVVSSVFLNSVTHHGKSVPAPDFVGLTVPEAQQIAREAKVRVEVIDTAYVKGVQRGGVFMQDPSAGSQVKKGRTIRLVVNSVVPKKVVVPNVVDCNVRQAVSDLIGKGLEVGRLIYVSGNDDLVISQSVASGTQVESGTRVNLRVGLDPMYRLTSVPNVLGERGMQAKKDIQERSLNIRRLSFDSTVKTYSDTLNAVVYRQTPEYGVSQVQKGTDVTLYLTMDPEKTSK